MNYGKGRKEKSNQNSTMGSNQSLFDNILFCFHTNLMKNYGYGINSSKKKRMKRKHGNSNEVKISDLRKRSV